MTLAPSEPKGSVIPKSHMLLTLGIMLFVGFLLTSTVSYLISRNSIRKAILQNELPLSSNNIYSEIQRDLFEPILISSLMANDTFVKDWILHGEADDRAITRYLKHIQDKYQTVTSFLVSEQTRKYYQANGVLKTISEATPVDDWFFRVRELKTDYEINVDPDMANKDTMTIFINYRILDAEGNFLAATGVGLSVNAVKSLMQEYRTRYHRDVYFYNRQGKLVLNSLHPAPDAHSPPNDHASTEAMRSILSQIAEGKTDINFSAVGEHGTLANYRYIPELEWILVVEQASDGTRSILFQSFSLNFVICLITAVALLGIIRKTVLRYQANLESRNRQLHEKNVQIESQSAELARANRNLDAMHREKDEFFGITVHDLKNPLSSVLGFTDLLLREDSLTPEARDYANCVSVSARSMLEQVEDLLKLTELEAPTAIQLKPCDAVSAVRQALLDYEFHAKAKSILLVVDLPADPVRVNANEKWLVSSIRNLLSNAIKYSPAETKVCVSLQRNDAQVTIAIRDEGEGISLDEQERLFRKFERLTPRPTAGESSSGLGLYLVKQMVQRMGGRVWCESEPGSGSTFVIALPLS